MNKNIIDIEWNVRRNVWLSMLLLRCNFVCLVAPRIDRRNLRDVSISAGSTLKFDANVIGEPPPTIEWRAGGVPLK